MTTLTLGKLTLEDLQQRVQLISRGLGQYDWLQTEHIELSDSQQLQLELLRSRLTTTRTHLLNEATTWARVIYPLLSLAEQDAVQAWSEVSLVANYPQFSLEGIADGVLGPSIDGYLQTPYFVVVEAKKGLDASNPQFQLYGQMLAAAWLNWRHQPREPQEIFGSYTSSDSWTFFRAEVSGLDSDRPQAILESSREFSERLEAEAILKILKNMITTAAQPSPTPRP